MRSRTWISAALALALALAVAAPATFVLAALPPNLSWTKSASNPVLAGGACGPGEVFRPSVVFESADNYKAYVSNRDSGADIYLATTTDGGLTWTCANGGSPVLVRGTVGAWDADRVLTVSVVRNSASDYRMWYTGRNAAGVYAIGYATSTDGITWLKFGSNPVLVKGGLGAWDSQYIREPSVVNVSGTYHLFYSGTDNWPRFKIGHATSPDGFTWTKDGANPVLVGTPGSWDQNETYGPSVVMNGAVFEMFYSGNNGNAWLTGHASSPDGIVWTKDANAIISPDTTGLESGYDSTDYAGAVLDSGEWKLFYSAGGSYRIHLATLINQAQLTFRPLATSLQTGSSTVVTIDLTAVTNLYGYQFQVNFDSSKVSAVGAFVTSFFDTAEPAAIPPGWNAVCAGSVCKFAVSRVSPQTAVSGSGPLAQITFTGVAPGTVPITFDEDILSNVDGGSLAHSKTTGWLTVYGSATINGTVNLQGRATPVSAGTVTLTDFYGQFGSVTVPFSALDGTFSASVPADAGTEYIIQANHSVYLSNKYGVSGIGGGLVVSPGGTYPAGTTTLRAGDANNDQTINIADLSCIGGAFGGGPSVCGLTGSSDINEDTTVNIFDLVLAGGNFNLSSPRPW